MTTFESRRDKGIYSMTSDVSDAIKVQHKVQPNPYNDGEDS
ncbi:MAG: hypothetical protein VB957_13770 [Pseudomonadales bacterium]|jgi:hypothetical protein